ncbi:Chromosomal replication initiator protein DnaA [Candidatus Deianiraea vastatrix]|uniref:Chromosomal replication initiator protein DnaA n=2 Tax=Candidatus Deianiraea vastatrix TaxID=2163644 RepID=A0A5B8XD40_9RICK|nr:Chromosomal replication initiator protein DnaA [Candidatus Deianiraea vastatrix]
MLSETIGKSAFETWFANLNIQVDGEKLFVKVKNQSELQWIKKNYDKQIKLAALETYKISDISYIIGGELKVVSHSNIVKLEAEKKDEVYKKSFIIDDSNKIAYSTVNYLLENRNSSVVHGKILHIFGKSGFGKTALLQHIFNQLGSEAIFFSAIEFVNLYSSSVRKNEVDAFRKEIFAKKFLIIDDINQLATQKGSLAEVSRIASIFADSNKVLITSANVSAMEIPNNIAVKVKGFLSCLSVRLEEPSIELKYKFGQDLLAQHGILGKVDAKKVVKKSMTMRDIDASVSKIKMSIVSNNLSLFEEFATSSQDNFAHDAIISLVAQKFAVDKNKMFLRGGGKDVSSARYVAIYLLRKKTNMTMQAIAAVFNLKSHTNIVRAIDIVQNEESSKEILTAISEIEKMLDK